MHVNKHCRAADNALAETISSLSETEVFISFCKQSLAWQRIRKRSSRKNMEEVEPETLKWVDWFNNRRLLGPIGNIPPAEAEENH